MNNTQHNYSPPEMFHNLMALDPRVRNAFEFADHYHKEAGQIREGTNLPYVSHPVEVALNVLVWSKDTDTIVAAILHDVIEDTSATKSVLIPIFGHTVANLVEEVTNVAVKGRDESRGRNAAINSKRTTSISIQAKQIKLADIKHNTHDLAILDRRWALTYIQEKWEQIHALYQFEIHTEFEMVRQQIKLVAIDIGAILPILGTPHTIVIPEK